MTKREVFVLALFLGLVAGGARAEGLSVGDDAPKLTLKEFVQGEPITKFEKDTVYVIEFWATWCGPCRTAIPHLTELQRKHPAVMFIGVSVWERDQDKVKPFVKEMGEKMTYRVALDDVPEDKKGSEGAMAKGWMAAAGRGVIPATFIVDGAGKIAWIGLPSALDDPLEKIITGKWDLKAAAAEAKQRRQEEVKLEEQRKALAPLIEEVQKAQQSGKPLEGVEAIDRAIAKDARLELPLIMGYRFHLLCLPKGDPEKALAYGEKLFEGTYKDDPKSLMRLVWSIVAPPEFPTAAARKDGAIPDEKLLKLAVKMVRKADELNEGKDLIMPTWEARAHCLLGNPDKAIEILERTIQRASTYQPAPGQLSKLQVMDFLKAQLAETKKSAENKKE